MPSPVAPERLIRQLCARMSLRKPQERSLEILHEVGNALDPVSSLDDALAAI